MYIQSSRKMVRAYLPYGFTAESFRMDEIFAYSYSEIIFDQTVAFGYRLIDVVGQIIVIIAV